MNARITLLGFTIATLMSVPLSLPLGATDLPLAAIWDSLRQLGAGDPRVNLIVWELRMPRALLAAGAGAGLALAGLIMQTLLRNPLADPFIVGVSSGASLAAISVMLLDIGLWLGHYRLPLAGFSGSLFSLIMIWLLARKQTDNLRLVLIGVAMSFFYTALGSLMILSFADHGLDAIYFWQQGSVADAHWSTTAIMLGVLALCGALLLRQQDALNSLLLGEQKASSLGIDLPRLRWLLLGLAALLTGVSVALCGIIGFVGLIVPHCCRLLLGDNHRLLLPASLLLGAAYLTWVDALCRWLLAPEELALSILTALSAVPFFLYLVLRGQRSV
ncbi:MAG: iron ABC transporter permease [Pseudomonadota bacterium]